MFDVMNIDVDATNTLRSTGYCHGFVRRLRTSVSGQIVEDIQDFNRVSHLFNILEYAQTRLNDMCEGFGYFDDIDQLEEPGELPGVKAGGYQTVLFQPLCGIFNQSKYLPLRYMPIEIELELADNDAPIMTNSNTLYTDANTSVSWRIQNLSNQV